MTVIEPSGKIRVLRFADLDILRIGDEMDLESKTPTGRTVVQILGRLAPGLAG